MKPTFRLPDTSSRVGTDVFSLRKCRPKSGRGYFRRKCRPTSGSHFFSQEMPSHIARTFFSAGKCRPEPGNRFFRLEMPSRIGRPFFPPGGVVPNRDAVFSLSLCVPHYCSAPFGGWAAGLDNKVSYLIYALSSGIVSFVQLGHKFCHASHSCHLAFTHFIRSTQQGSLSFRTRQKTLVFDVQFDLRHSI